MTWWMWLLIAGWIVVSYGVWALVAVGDIDEDEWDEPTGTGG